MVMFCFLSCLTDCGVHIQKKSAEQHRYKMEIYPTR